MHSVSEENYIKTIYHLQEGKNLVSTNDIAGRMSTKASSVTDMLKKLAEKNLAEYIPYKGTRLTQNGINCATQIIRKHRLWEVFLVEKLNFSWDEVHEVAEQLEHIQSRKLIDEMDQLLGFPKYDPHGDPIPDAQGNYEKITKTAVSQLEKGQKGILTGVLDTSTRFLKYLDKHQIELGTPIELIEKESFDGTCHIKTDQKEIHISKTTADNLYLKKIS
ncbi:metal-dependent transcriptional regulator [Nonlabens mediterrranea]|uniref:Transcriptional regulator MntR n=1 Tax=Nonlabens mediterrranea TaxID=1419947 RepID=A0ABS0A5S6_9FLAO|nr:putative Mn- or Fe-dependent transcriptional regulator [Flavobacteria bacterium BBFL7]MBF4984659.1 metal-dependent transcriptional regulator [Nonlabens mediterrranea]